MAATAEALFADSADGIQLQSAVLPKDYLRAIKDLTGADEILVQPTLVSPADAKAKRVRDTRLNTGLFRGSHARQDWEMSRLLLNLFPDQQPTAVIVRTQPMGSERWIGYGYIEGCRDSQFTLAVDGDAIAATVFMPGQGTYRILSRGNQMHTVSEIDPERVDHCGGDRPPVVQTESGPVRKSASTGGSMALATLPSAVTNNLVTVVDVMVVYTPEARAGAGGTAGMNALIDLAIAEANIVYQNSEVRARLRLAYRGEVNYLESSSTTTDLNRLQSPDDGFLNEVHPLRDTNRADVVCLITERGDPGVAGLAFTMSASSSSSFRTNAFSVVKRSAAVGSYIFAHEISHNFGCQHDRENAFDAEGKMKPGAYPYSYDYRFAVGNTTYRTIMAYQPGQLIPYLSNPNVLFLGVPVGQAGTTNGMNNALTINNTASIVGSFYGPLVQTATPTVVLTSLPPGAVFNSGINLVLTAQAGDSDGRVQQVEYYTDTFFLGAVTNPLAGSTNLPAFTTNLYSLVWSNIPSGEYRVTARAIDNAGACSASAPIGIIVRPINDSSGNPSPIVGTSPIVQGSNRAATLDSGEPNHAGNPGGRSVWYSWLAPKSGTVFLAVTGNGFQPLCDVYKSVNATSLTAIPQEFTFENSQVHATFDAVGGASYAIAVDGLNGAAGDFTLSLLYEVPPQNDSFANRTALTGEAITLTAANMAATSELGEPMHAGNAGGKSVWYSWRAPRSGAVVITGAATNFFPLVDIYVGSGISILGLEIGLLQNAPQRQIVFDQTNSTATVTLEVTAGQDYAVAVDGFAGRSGKFTLTLSYPQSPPNDNFANRLQLSGTSVTLPTSNLYATKETGEPLHAGAAGGRSVWYSWKAPVSGPVTVTARGDRFFTLLNVYTGDALNALTNVPRQIIKYDQTNFVSTLTFTASAFQTYALAVDGFQGGNGAITLTLATAYVPPSAQLFSTSNPSKTDFKLRLFGATGQSYVIQASTNLLDWSDVSIGTFTTNSAAFTDQSSGNFSHRFYRILPFP